MRLPRAALSVRPEEANGWVSVGTGPVAVLRHTHPNAALSTSSSHFTWTGAAHTDIPPVFWCVTLDRQGKNFGGFCLGCLAALVCLFCLSDARPSMRIREEMHAKFCHGPTGPNGACVIWELSDAFSVVLPWLDTYSILRFTSFVFTECFSLSPPACVPRARQGRA